MKRKLAGNFSILSFIIFIIAGCNLVSSSTNSPEGVVESYIKALVAKDSNTLSNLSCADWEQSAIREFDSLQAVKVRLDGLSCGKTGVDGDYSLVNCTGKIIATYNGEDQNFDLSTRNYKVMNNNGEYLVCGYQ